MTSPVHCKLGKLLFSRASAAGSHIQGGDMHVAIAQDTCMHDVQLCTYLQVKALLATPVAPSKNSCKSTCNGTDQAMPEAGKICSKSA